MLIIIPTLVLLMTIKLLVKTDFGRYKLEEKVRIKKRFLMPDVQVYEKIKMSLSERIALYALIPASIIAILIEVIR